MSPATLKVQPTGDPVLKYGVNPHNRELPTVCVAAPRIKQTQRDRDLATASALHAMRTMSRRWQSTDQTSVPARRKRPACVNTSSVSPARPLPVRRDRRPACRRASRSTLSGDGEHRQHA